MNKLEIEIPIGKEIDWQESAKQEKIVFKDRQLTYEEVCEKLFDKGHYYTGSNGNIAFVSWTSAYPNNATTQHQLECILAKNKLANVARYLNGEWKPDLVHDDLWILVHVSQTDHIIAVQARHLSETSNILFNSASSAKQAIEILGEETVKLALTPLY